MSKVVLLLGSNDRAALEAVRSLGSHDILVDTIYFEKRDLAEYSRYCRQTFFFGNPSHDYHKFTRSFKDLIRSKSYELVIPINDIANEIVMSEVEYLSQHTTVAAPANYQYEYAHDKIKSLQKCQEVGIPVPKSVIITEYDLSVCEQITYPVYAKPQYSTLLKNGKLYNFNVRKITSDDQLDNFLRDNIHNAAVMLQEPIGGHGVGMNVVAKNGKILSYGITRRIHEPANGGNSSYRKSIPLDTKLEGYAKKLVKALNWTGLAMLEFKYDGNDYYLMEINPRLWGSVGLSKYSGIDFPTHLYNLFSKSPVEVSPHYRPGRYTRNLTRDIHWSLRQLSRRRFNAVIISLFTGFYRIASGREKIDEFSWKDWSPFFQSLRQITWRYAKPIFRKEEKVKHREGVPQISQSTNLLFVCKGNINRSAFAAEYLRQIYALKADSAGTLLKRNRKCSRSAALIGPEYGVDMSNHSSQSIYDIDMKNYDYCIVFDDQNFRAMLEYNQEQSKKIFYLKEGTQIFDPHGKSIEFFKKTFESIIDELDSKLSI